MLGTMQRIIILAVLLALYVNTKPANKSFQNSTGTDRYTLTEQSDFDANCRSLVLSIALKCM